MANLIKSKKPYTNYLIGAAVIAAAVAGYYYMTSTPAAGPAPDPSDTTGKTTPAVTPNPSPAQKPPVKGGCNTTAAEFPLKMGSGTATNANAYCEKIYVQVVQMVLNKFLKNDGKTLLTVDGIFGAKTEAAVKYYYGDLTYVSKAQYDSMMDFV